MYPPVPKCQNGDPYHPTMGRWGSREAPTMGLWGYRGPIDLKTLTPHGPSPFPEGEGAEIDAEGEREVGQRVTVERRVGLGRGAAPPEQSGIRTRGPAAPPRATSRSGGRARSRSTP